MPFFEIFKGWNQGFRIGKWFIFIRRFWFLFNNDVRVRIQIILVIKINGANNAKSIGRNAKFISIAEMTIHILLLYFMVSSGGCRHRGIGCLVRIIRIIEVMSFSIGLKLFNNAVGVFGIVFSHICFNPWSIKQKHRGEITVNVLADWFCDIYEIIKNWL